MGERSDKNAGMSAQFSLARFGGPIIKNKTFFFVQDVPVWNILEILLQHARINTSVLFGGRLVVIR